LREAVDPGSDVGERIGYVIHCPDLDEDIGVEGLLLGKHSMEIPSSFERWLHRRRQKLPQDAA